MKRSRRKGQSLVETSLILAAFLGLLLGMVTIGQTLFVRQTFAERVHEAARWGAVNTYDPAAIRNIVQYGTTAPSPDATPFMGLTDSEIVVTAPGCPGAQCRVIVAIPAQGIHSTEPAESSDRPTAAVPSQP
jgi:Flp pilus assembly protein TadG